MKTLKRGTTLVALLTAFTATPGRTQSGASVEIFYKDKTIQILVGYGVGTGNDLYMRLLARHIGKHIPGRPTIVPRNMPGAGGIVMFNHLYNVAPRGIRTVLAHPSRSLITEPLYGNPQARYDARKFGWIGSMNRDVATCVAWRSSGITIKDDSAAKSRSGFSLVQAAHSN